MKKAIKNKKNECRGNKTGGNSLIGNFSDCNRYNFKPIKKKV